MEKLKPHYALTDIKAAFAEVNSLNRSFVPKQGADELHMNDAAVVEVIQALSHQDFEKSMTQSPITGFGRTFTSRWLTGSHFM